MPPKKKKGGKKKKKKAQEGELTIEDKYKRTMDEIEALKDQLAVRKEFARRSRAHQDEWKTQMQEAKHDLKIQNEDHRAVSADMTRQYKTMQTEMQLQIHQLQSELNRTRTQLYNTEQELKKTQEEKEKMQKEKDNKISELQLKIDSMGIQYESILNDALDKLGEKLDHAKMMWEDRSTLIQDRNKQALLEFGLNPLDL